MSAKIITGVVIGVVSSVLVAGALVRLCCRRGLVVLQSLQFHPVLSCAEEARTHPAC